MNTKEIIKSLFQNRTGVLASMHKKEIVMGPLLEKELGITLSVPLDLNTDLFGTFSGEFERKGDQLEAAKHKAEEIISITGESLAFASEGSFSPHPFIPFLPINREIIYMIDKKNQFEVIGEAVTTDTNFKSSQIRSLEEAFEFCQTIGYPEHAVIMRNTSEIVKGIQTKEQLKEAYYVLHTKSAKEIIIETNMRALYNPTRMKNIEKATANLIEKIYSLCPSCTHPGFEVVEITRGLPCSWCNLPTNLIQSEIYRCKKCGYTDEKMFPAGIKQSDPTHCSYCNP